MKKILVFLLLFTSACSDRFVADFENDTLDAPPSALPPGLPDDDRVILTNTPVRGDGNIVIITDEPQFVAPGEPARFMSLIRQENPGLASSVALRSDAMATSDESIYLTWEQVLDNNGEGRVTVQTYPIQEGFVHCVITTINDEIPIYCDSSPGPQVSGTITGIDTQSLHTVYMRIDRPSNRVAFQVIQNDEASTVLNLTPSLAPSPIAGERLSAFLNFEGQGSSAYRFNRFTIQEKNPPE